VGESLWVAAWALCRPIRVTKIAPQCPLAHRLQPIYRLGDEDPLLDVRRQERRV
jgi:hypothetical protein